VRSEALSDVFQGFHGFIEVRHIPDKGVAFVEFVNDDFAAMALQVVSEQESLAFPDETDPSVRVIAKINFGKK
jgi:hypothetical protein